MITQAVDLTICDIVQQQLGLTDSQVVVYDQNYEPPTDESLYLVIIQGDAKILANNRWFDTVLNQEVLDTVISQDFKINITSRGRTANDRKEEVLQAFVAQYALRVMEDQQISIWRDPNIVDLSFIEGGSALQRFQVTIKCQYMKQKRQAADYISVADLQLLTED